MDDLISREQAIKSICEDGTWLERQGCVDITMAERKQRDVDILQALPSAEPVQKTGKWRFLDENNDKAGYRTLNCSVCGDTFYCVPKWKYRYCPNCGARMVGEEE